MDLHLDITSTGGTPLKVKFGLGFLRTDPTKNTASTWALGTADVTTASEVTIANQGLLPGPIFTRGAVVLGVNADNGNNSWGTFYEGAVVAGFPSDDTERSVLQNIKAVGYGN